jgi:hypothetical protein
LGLDVYDDIERCMVGGWSDGLPVIPPYGSLVEDMLAAMGWDYTEMVGSLPEQSIEVHASHVAAAAVMAGCRFEYGPLLRALTLALLDPVFNLTWVEVTTGLSPSTVVVSGHDVGHIGPADIIVGIDRLRHAGQVDGPVAVASSTPYSFGFGLITPPAG